jgi:hypothetical protein
MHLLVDSVTVLIIISRQNFLEEQKMNPHDLDHTIINHINEKARELGAYL